MFSLKDIAEAVGGRLTGANVEVTSAKSHAEVGASHEMSSGPTRMGIPTPFRRSMKLARTPKKVRRALRVRRRAGNCL